MPRPMTWEQFYVIKLAEWKNRISKSREEQCCIGSIEDNAACYRRITAQMHEQFLVGPDAGLTEAWVEEFNA